MESAYKERRLLLPKDRGQVRTPEVTHIKTDGMEYHKIKCGPFFIIRGHPILPIHKNLKEVLHRDNYSALDNHHPQNMKQRRAFHVVVNLGVQT